MNLDLLFYAASQTNDSHLFDVAITHARTCQQAHIRPDFSTTHVINFEPSTGAVKERLTNQGMAHESCWTRGQAWAIAGFAETYHWTGDDSFLATAKGCARYFMDHLPDDKIPLWDFYAPADSLLEPQPTDTSAAMIAAYGLLLIHKAVLAEDQTESVYLATAVAIVAAVCKKHMNQAAVATTTHTRLQVVEIGDKQDSILGMQIGEGETILNGATINNFEHAPRRWANHGLVYADYYFMLFGNKLLEMGLDGLLNEMH